MRNCRRNVKQCSLADRPRVVIVRELHPASDRSLIDFVGRYFGESHDLQPWQIKVAGDVFDVFYVAKPWLKNGH